jgi:predicted metalloprotease with PDZ domain
LKINPEGKLLDVLPGSPAFAAGLEAGSKVVAVNGVKWSSSVLRDALAGPASAGGPLEFLIERAERLRTIRVDYHGGALYPHLERVPGVRDTLSEILAPRTGR